MAKHISLLNVGKFLLVILLVFSIVEVTYAKTEIFDLNTTPIDEASSENLDEISTTLEDSIVNFAMALLGKPYVPAGCGLDGFDCSGLVNFVFNNYGIKVPRISREFEHFGTEIPLENVQKGDVLIFLSSSRDVINHVGIVTHPNGMESEFIHAASGRDKQVRISTITSKGYTWRVLKAVRVF